MRPTLATLCALGIGLSLVACRGGGSSGDDDDTPDSGPGGVTIQQVQSDDMAPGTPVELHGVIVVAIDKYGMRQNDIYVMEPGGGEYSGVHVFGGPAAKINALAVGDVISITGAEKDEFALSSDTSGRTITELKPVTGGMMDIVKTGTDTVPAPKVIDALAIGQLPTPAERDAEWEKWEGVLVTLNNITAFNSPSGVSNSDSTLKTVDATGGIVLESALADFPAGVTRNACLASATGIVDYFFDYLLFHRTGSDLATGGTACPPPESTSGVCGDDIDNDGNGFKDCEDNGCVIAEATCREQTTISAIQAAIPTKAVELADVYIVARSKDMRNLFVSTALNAAPNEGIYIFGTGASLPDTMTPGAKVKVIGRARERNNDAMGETVTQIAALDITLNTPAAAAPVPVPNQKAAMLTQATTGEPYESVYVALNDVKITKIGTPNFYVGEGTQEGTAFLTDDDLVDVDPADLNKCFTLTGVWTYQVFDNKYGLLPLSKVETPCPTAAKKSR